MDVQNILFKVLFARRNVLADVPAIWGACQHIVLLDTSCVAPLALLHCICT